jgi:hypothetical protein
MASDKPVSEMSAEDVLFHVGTYFEDWHRESGNESKLKALALLTAWRGDRERDDSALLRAALVRLVNGQSLLDAPCLWCAYNGIGYWRAKTHGAACPWHNVGSFDERARKVDETLGLAALTRKDGANG